MASDSPPQALMGPPSTLRPVGARATGTVVDRAGVDTYGDRITRLFAIFVGAGYLAYVPVLVPGILAQWRYTHAWWPPLAIGVIFVPAVTLLVTALRMRMRAAHLAARAAALGFLIASASWPFAWTGGLLPQGVWFSAVPGVAALAAAVTWPPRVALVILLATVIPSQLINHYAQSEASRGSLLSEVAFALSFCLLFVAAAMMAIRTGRVLDQTRAAAELTAADSAAQLARKVQQDRFDALLHDWVMSSLLAASRHGNTDEVRRQAAETLRTLDAADDDVVTFSATDVVARLRTAVAAVDDLVPVTTDHDSTGSRRPLADTTYPAEVVLVLSAAVAEAVRNSVRHAGPAASCSVTIVLEAQSVTVVVADDGVGFDPSAVSPQRLGLAVSILSRVRALAGGAAVVTSRPGDGTVVTMRGRRPGG